MSSEMGPFGRFHHIGIAVPDLDEPTQAMCDLLGGQVVDRGEDDELAAGWVWIEAPGSPIMELVAPTRPEGPIAAYLERHGSGLHHVSYYSSDVGAAGTHARGCGLGLIGESDDHDGFEELFVHPRHTGGALLHTFRDITGTRLNPETGARV